MQVLKTHENVYIIDGRLFSQGLSLHYHQDRHYQEQTSGGRGGPHAACIICGGTWFFGVFQEPFCQHPWRNLVRLLL